MYAGGKLEFLTELITTLDVASGTAYTEINNAKEFEFATSNEVLMFYIDSAIKVTRTNPTMTTEFIGCDKIDKTIAHKFAKTGFNTPWFKNPKLFLEDNLIVIIHDDYTTVTTDLKFEYIKYPVRINVVSGSEIDCELRDFLHIDVVNKAIELLMKSYENDDRYRNIRERR